MNMRKTALASAVALALTSGSVFAATSTTSGEFILDKETVAAGGTVNLALLGLDNTGAVDRFGESGGSVIMAVVNTVKGNIMGGSDNPGRTPTDSNPTGGDFASDVSYVKLEQGNGKVHIMYPPTARGEDTIVIRLQERVPSSGGGIEIVPIGQSITKTVTITPPSTEPKGLNIMKFMPAPADPAGKADYDDMMMGDMMMGVKGKMTAGVDGGQITVKAKNPTAAGEVTVSLRAMGATSAAYEFTEQMLQGEAIITLDSSVTAAGTYYVEATFEGSDVSSVDLIHPDTLMVGSTGVPRGLKLSSDKVNVVKPDDTLLTATGCNTAGANGVAICQGVMVTAQLLDEYGNSTSNRAGGPISLQITDSTQTVSNTALSYQVPAGSTNGKATPTAGDAYIGNAAGEILRVNSSTSLVATAVDSNVQPIATIAASEPLVINIKADALQATSLFSTPQLAGSEFDAFTVTLTDGAGAAKTIDPGSITIGSGAGETITVNRNSTSGLVKALFTKATSNTKYLLGNKAGTVGEIWVDVAGSAIIPAAATQVQVENAHKQVITQINPGDITTQKQYITEIPEVVIKMFDSFANAITGDPIVEDITGTFTVTSSNGTVSYMTTEGDKGVPGRGGNNKVMVTYDAEGAKKFAGDDAIAVNFTKPGLGSNNLTITSTVPGLTNLSEIKTHIEKENIPVNSEVALAVEVLDQDGNVFTDADAARNTVVKIEFNKESFGDDEIVPEVFEVRHDATGMTTTYVPVTNGQSLNFTESNGRKVFSVAAGPVPGRFSLTFTDADESVDPAVQNFQVGAVLVDECDENNLELCTTTESCRDAGGVFLSGFTGVQDGCFGLPGEAQQIRSRSIKIDTEQTFVDASFKGGVLVGDAFQSNTTVSIADLDTTTLAYNYTPISTDIGKSAALLAVVGIEPPAEDGGFSGDADTNYFGFSEFVGEIYPVNLYVGADDWPAEVANLEAQPYFANTTILAKETVVFVPGDLTGVRAQIEEDGLTDVALYFFIGYILEDDTIVFNDFPIILNVTP